MKKPVQSVHEGGAADDRKGHVKKKISEPSGQEIVSGSKKSTAPKGSGHFCYLLIINLDFVSVVGQKDAEQNLEEKKEKRKPPKSEGHVFPPKEPEKRKG